MRGLNDQCRNALPYCCGGHQQQAERCRVLPKLFPATHILPWPKKVSFQKRYIVFLLHCWTPSLLFRAVSCGLAGAFTLHLSLNIPNSSIFARFSSSLILSAASNASKSWWILRDSDKCFIAVNNQFRAAECRVLLPIPRCSRVDRAVIRVSTRIASAPVLHLTLLLFETLDLGVCPCLELLHLRQQIWSAALAFTNLPETGPKLSRRNTLMSILTARRKREGSRTSGLPVRR